MILLAGNFFYFWLFLSRQITVNSSSTQHDTGSSTFQRRLPQGLSSVWGYCGSRYGLNEADVTEALNCVSVLETIDDKTITVGKQDQPRLLCDRDTAKIWISPFLNKPYLPAQDSFTFRTVDIQNFTLQGAIYCCGDGKASTCSGWGLLSETPGRNDVLISINNADKPEPVPCNSVAGCDA